MRVWATAAMCDGATCTILGYRGGVKARSITQSRVSLVTFFPSCAGGIFGTYQFDGSLYTVVRAYLNCDPNPGDPGRHVYNKTH